jgi:hypothetical protein
LNGGSKTRRCRACGSSSSTSTEFFPTEAARNSFPSPECRAWGSPRNTSLTASGEANMTNRPYPAQWTVNGSP